MQVTAGPTRALSLGILLQMDLKCFRVIWRAPKPPNRRCALLVLSSQGRVGAWSGGVGGLRGSSTGDDLLFVFSVSIVESLVFDSTEVFQ